VLSALGALLLLLLLPSLLLLPLPPPPLVRSFLARTTLLIPSEKHCIITCYTLDALRAELGDCDYNDDDDDNDATDINNNGPRNDSLSALHPNLKFFASSRRRPL